MIGVVHRAATAPRAGASIRVLDSWSEFPALAEPWEELTRASGSGPFVSHRWLSAWWDSFGDGLAPRVPQVWRDGLLVAAAPLSLSRRSVSRWGRFLRVNCLEMMSNLRTGYNQWLIAPGHDDAIELLLQTILSSVGDWHLADLEPLRCQPTLEKIMTTATAARVPFSIDYPMQAVTVDLAQGWEAYFAGRPARFRQHLRACERRIAARNHRLWRERDAGQEVMDRILDLSVRSWKGRRGTALGSNEAGRRFMHRLQASFGATGDLSLYLLDIDGNEASSAVVVHDDDVVHLFATDFDEAYAALSPGRFVIAAWLKDAAAAGYATADMLRSTPFLQTFSDDRYPLARLRMFPRHNLAYAWIKLEDSVRPFGRKWRAARRYAARRRPAYKVGP